MSMTTRAFAVLLLLLSLACAPAVGARDLLVSSRFGDNVLRYDGDSGEFKSIFASGHGLDNPNGIAFGPDGDLYVGLGDVGRVMVFSGQTGDYLRDFVSPATPGGLAGCRAIAFLPNGDLLVDAGPNNQVLRYAAGSGAFLGVFATGVIGPVGLTVAPNGEVYVGAAIANTVYVYDANGSLKRSFHSPAGQSNATGVLIAPDGRLLLAESVSNAVLALDPNTGAGATFATGGLDIPIGMTFHPNGDLLVGSFNTNKVLRFDSHTGALIGDFVASGAGGLSGTHNLAVFPADASARINIGHAGSWFEPATAGQGQIVEIIPERHQLQSFWFTHAAVASGDDSGQQRWLVASGDYAGSTATLTVYIATGGRFDAPPALDVVAVGDATLRFLDCSHARFDYRVFEGAVRGVGSATSGVSLSGSIPLTRLAPDSLCASLSGGQH